MCYQASVVSPELALSCVGGSETLPAGVTGAPGVAVTRTWTCFLWALPQTQPRAAFFWGALLGSWIHLGRRLADPLS